VLWLTYTFVYTRAVSNTDPLPIPFISYNSRREPARLTGTKRMTAVCRMFPGSTLKLQHNLYSARAIVKYSVSSMVSLTTKQLKMQ